MTQNGIKDNDNNTIDNTNVVISRELFKELLRYIRMRESLCATKYFDEKLYMRLYAIECALKECEG